MNHKTILPAILLLGICAAAASADPGELDEYGCHAGKEPHHCHQGGGPATGPALATVAAVSLVVYLIIDNKRKRNQRRLQRLRNAALATPPPIPVIPVEDLSAWAHPVEDRESAPGAA